MLGRSVHRRRITPGKERVMRVGVFYFPTDYGIEAGELARALEERGFEFALRLRAHPYPGQPQIALPGRRRTAEALRPHPRSFRRAVLRRRGDEDAAARHRRLPGAAARPDHHRQIHRQPRPALGRPLRLRHRRRLERRGDGEPRRPLRHPLQADARTRAGDEGAVDAGGSRASTANSSTSTRSGATRSRCSSRIRRSCSAARPTTR